jgi:hypothetical protein
MPNRAISILSVALVLVLVLVTTPGCFIIGAAIGANESHVRHVHPDKVRPEAFADRASSEKWNLAQHAALQHDCARAQELANQVRKDNSEFYSAAFLTDPTLTTCIEQAPVYRKSYVGVGLIIGLALDVAVIGALLWASQNVRF